MTEPAGIWMRVSDLTQDESNQTPDLEAWCEAHNYTIARRFPVHGKSAWKPGKLDADKRAVLDAISTGEIKVLVVWSVDRWSRAGIADLLGGLRMIRDAGGRVEFVKDSILNQEGPVQELLIALLAWVAEWESKRRSQRTKAGQARERANGKIMGGHVPFGYRLVKGERVRDEAALAVVTEVFERSARGESTATIAQYMNRAGYYRRDNTVADILRNAEYVADGLVSGALATSAIAALEGRRTGPARRTHGESYSGMVWCRCGLVMHRKPVGGMPVKGVEPTLYYRCSGEKKAHPAGPVPMVRTDDTNVLVSEVMSGDTLPWMKPVRLGGDTRDADKARLLLTLPKAKTRAETDAIWDAIDAVEKREPVPERVVWVPSGKTRGQRWHELTIPERRAWLESEDTRIVVWPVKQRATGIVNEDHSAWSRGKVRLFVGAR